MTDDSLPLPASRMPPASRPLLGLTVLLVEDSRFASEAMRLLCLRSGARIRRADTLRAARRHLATYRPSVVIVDMGLPDGSGAELIGALAAMTPRVPVILGTSGAEEAEPEAMAAGADGFLPKPVASLAIFQTAILAALPPESRPAGPRLLPEEQITPDPIALRDDLAHAADMLSRAACLPTDGAGNAGPPPDTATPDPATLDYVTQFLAGLARISNDAPLADAAIALRRDRAAGRATGAGVRCLSGLVRQRLASGRPL